MLDTKPTTAAVDPATVPAAAALASTGSTPAPLLYGALALLLIGGTLAVLKIRGRGEQE